MFPGQRSLGHSFCHCPGFPRLWGSLDVPKRSGSRFTAPTEPTALSSAPRMAQSGDEARPPSPRGALCLCPSPWSSPQLSYERGQAERAAAGPKQWNRRCCWGVSALCEDRGKEERGKVGSRRSGAWLVDSGLAWDESSQTFCPSHLGSLDQTLNQNHTPTKKKNHKRL